MVNIPKIKLGLLVIIFIFAIQSLILSTTAVVVIQPQPPYVPITLTNNQNVATPLNFQQHLSFTPSSYNKYEAQDLGNIRFYNSGKQNQSNELYSWCESGCNTSSGIATFWVKLPNGIAANTQTVVNMTFLASNTEYDANYAGKAPTVVVTTPVSSYEISGGNENGGSNTIVLSVGGNHNSFLCIPAGNENIPAVVTGNTCTITSPPWAPGEAAGAMLGISSTVGVPVNYTSPVYGFSGGSPFDFNFNVITPDAFVVLLASCSGVTCNNGGIPTNQGYPNTTVNLNALNSSCTLSQNYVSSDAQSNILVYICSSVNAGSYSISVNNQGYTFMSAYVYSPPQIVNYATYDNGANVFPTLYQNFAGTSCPSGWSCPSGGVNNGYISSSIKTQNANFYYLSSNVLDVYASYQNLPASMSMNGLSIGYQFSAPLCSGGHCTLPSPAQFGWSESPTCGNYICPYSNYSGYNSAVLVTSGVSQVLSTYYNTSTNTYDFEVNYGQKSSLPSYLPEEPLYSRFRIVITPTLNSSMNANWARIRAYPPNGVMPAAAFGKLKSVPLTIILTSTSNSVDLGKTLIISNDTIGGYPPYSYSYTYLSMPSSIMDGSIVISNNIVTPSSIGNYTLFETVTDSTFHSATNSISIAVTPPPNVTISPQNVVEDVGQTTMLNAIPSGGSGNNMYTWYINNRTVTSPSSNAMLGFYGIQQFTLPSYATLSVILTDSSGNTASNSILTTINADPRISITPSANSITASGSVTFNNVTSGGTAPFQYTYFVSNMSGVTVSGNTITFANAGIYNVTENVKDNAAFSANSLPVTITIVAAPTTTIPAGGGGGGNTGGGIPAVSSFRPTVINISNGFLITNFSTPNTESVVLHGKAITSIVSSISPNESVVLINGKTYILTLNNPVVIDPSLQYIYYATLRNISYIPIRHTITLDIYAVSNVTTTTSTTTTIPKTTTSTSTKTTAFTTTVHAAVVNATSNTLPPNSGINPPSSNTNLLVGGSLLIVGAILAVLYVFNMRAKSKGRAGSSKKVNEEE